MADALAPVGATDDLSQYPTCLAPGANGLLGLRLGALFGILAVSTIGIAIPYFTYTVKLGNIFFLLRAFAAGVVLTTGFVHVLGDAYPILTDPCLGWSGEYPWAMTIATAAALMAFTLEWLLHKAFLRSHGLSGSTHTAHGQATGRNADINEEGLKKDDEHVKTLNNVVIATVFEIGIIFHSIFIGITLGISSDRSTVTALMIALFFHQGNEGLALGVLMVKAKYSALKYFLLAAAFVVVTPLGVGIGIGVSNNYNGESHAALASEGIFDSISAGILIYNGLCDLIIPTFADDELPKSWVLRAVGFGSLYTGAAIMALIGKWA